MEHYSQPSVELAIYTAAFIDADGSVGFAGNRFNAKVSQSTVNRGDELCQWFRDSWGIGSTHTLTIRNSSFNQNGKICEWNVGGTRQVVHLLRAIIPYMRVKRERAEQVLAAAEARLAAGRRSTWSSGQDAILREHWLDWRNADIARAVGKCTSAIKHRARRLGLAAKPPGGMPGIGNNWSPADEQQLRELYGKRSYREIGRIIGKSKGAVRSRADRIGLPKLR